MVTFGHLPHKKSFCFLCVYRSKGVILNFNRFFDFYPGAFSFFRCGFMTFYSVRIFDLFNDRW